MKSNEKKDPRITKKYHTWSEVIVNFILLVCLSGSQALISNEYDPIKFISPGQLWAYGSYWAMVALVISLVSAGIRIRKYETPMRRLSRAAKRVASGDFSVFVDNGRAGPKKDYIDVLFDDFNTMVKELGSTETLKNDFIANVSHEFKTPLSIIQNYATALQDESISAETKIEYTQTILDASKKLSVFVSNILKLNKMENEKIRPEPAPYDICRQLCDCALAFEPVWENKNITFDADIEDRAVITADEGLLELVWNNLLSNAFKYTENGGTVTLRQTSADNTVTVRVSDTGCGMDAVTMNHLFDKFYQGDTSHSGEGNGLGLALAKKALDLCGGTITVESEQGSGSSFTVTLPV